MTHAVVVVVPAHDEAETIGHTLLSVQRSIAYARCRGLVGDVAVEVRAHRCTDATARIARAVLLPAEHGSVEVTPDEHSHTVGEVRDAGARQGLLRLGSRPERAWVLSTDADTRVGKDWVAQILTAATRTRSVGVVGLARLDRWCGSEQGEVAYRRLLASRMRTDEHHQHDHVYGANLAVRADAYLDVGGFPPVVHGEDQALVDALSARGHRLLRTRAIQVVTSGRLRGRADGGLAHHLARLDHDARRAATWGVVPGAAADTIESPVVC